VSLVGSHGQRLQDRPATETITRRLEKGERRSRVHSERSTRCRLVGRNGQLSKEVKVELCLRNCAPPAGTKKKPKHALIKKNEDPRGCETDKWVSKTLPDGGKKRLAL